MIRRILVVTLSFVTVSSALAQPLATADPTSVGLSEKKLELITEMLERQVAEQHIGGAVVAIARQGKVGYLQAVGEQDAKSHAKMDTDTIFRIASMTKAVTSAAVMKLVEEGKLALNDPVAKHLPEFANLRVLASIDDDDTSTVPAERPPTIHDFLTHRSGLTYGWAGPEKLDAIYRQQNIPDLFVPISETIRDRARRIASVPLKFQPGTAWEYSVATDVLGRVIEAVAGQTLDAYFREHFFQPLKMPDTYFALPKEKESQLAALYTVDEKKQIKRVTATPVTAGFLKFSADYCLDNNRFYSGGGGLVSTTGDYLRFLQMLLNGGELDGVRVLQPDTVKQMTTNQIGEMQIPFPGHGDGFGFGFGVLTERGAATDDASVGTFSWGGIFDSYYWVDPKEEFIGVLMTQVFPNDHLTTRAEFKRLAYESIVDRVHLVKSTKDKSAAGLDCYKIKTAHAEYYLDKVGAGLSSMIDRDGNDWIGFHPKPGTGAAGEFRGFPNAVFKEAGSYFHPRNAGTDPCVTIVEEESPIRVVISATSSNGLWAGRYTFDALGCTFTLTKKPANHNYWVLYEGTPGGKYDDTDWWMTSANSQQTPLTVPHEGDIASPEWIAFGDQNLDRTLVLHHAEDDAATDRFYQMEKKMTVFGFGREGMKKFLDTVPQNFSIRFIESTSHDVIDKTLSNNRLSHNARTSDTSNLEQFALTHHGDATAGQKLFFHDRRTQCSTCHVGHAPSLSSETNTQAGNLRHVGGNVGPDLSKIGGKFDRPHLIESLLEPSKQIVEGYRTTLIITDEGRSYSGIVKARDDKSITLVDSMNRIHNINTANIDEQTQASVSLMPTGLADALSPQEFTDLLAYLETLQTGKAKFGSGTTGPIRLPDGFEVETIATGLSGATAMELAPDGRVFVCEQHGDLRIIKDGKLMAQPFVTVPVEHNWERGLIGVTLSPNFESDSYVYVVYVAKAPHTHHRVSRFTAKGDVAVPGSEVVLLRGDDQSKFGGNVPAGHQGGAIHFGNDGKLYIGLGEQTAGIPSQRFDALQGKLLRINADGSIPADNPFVAETTGKYQSIWAIGCRNPFTFAVRRSTGEMLINDVGGKFEEINRGVAGANYGWPTTDHGPSDRDDVVSPIHIYPEASISGGDFSDSATKWPEKFRSKYFFGDFVHGWIKAIDPESPSKAMDFAQGLRRIVDLRFASDGSLYVLLRNAWVVDDKFEGGTGALMRIRYRE